MTRLKVEVETNLGLYNISFGENKFNTKNVYFSRIEFYIRGLEENQNVYIHS